ncbi:D-arabinono-1,4-lactone oxidase [Micromonospora echinofusca]|uniref:D-arabinono-1,4-lactone oxidase n=1 Tax=Micromonospora echinofusca TaxID=47858 RepID=UPI0020217021|nr:D-arabinono-1,4-lactone oxidase [Micromonospora sp. MSM11]MCL7456369.1 hypothetical protein [Micromonospora sp. MSM11]
MACAQGAGLGALGEPREVRAGPTHRTIPRHRELRFEEIEYMLPSEAFPACFAEVRQRHRRVAAWRVLVRSIAADDVWLSNAYGRPTTTIACLQNTLLPYEEYFRDMEAVFRQYGGRPHWGKKQVLRHDRGLPTADRCQRAAPDHRRATRRGASAGPPCRRRVMGAPSPSSASFSIRQARREPWPAGE